MERRNLITIFDYKACLLPTSLAHDKVYIEAPPPAPMRDGVERIKDGGVKVSLSTFHCARRNENTHANVCWWNEFNDCYSLPLNWMLAPTLLTNAKTKSMDGKWMCFSRNGEQFNSGNQLHAENRKVSCFSLFQSRDVAVLRWGRNGWW